MAFDWKDYHRLALQLEATAGENGIEEAALRSCVSRLYYGAFRTALKRAEGFNFKAEGFGGDHSALRRHLQSRGKRNVANLLGDLQIWREQCDYQDSVENLSAIVENAKETAESVYRLL
jgi:hypothetical protein